MRAAAIQPGRERHHHGILRDKFTAQEIPGQRLGAGGFFDQQDANGIIRQGGDIGGGA